MERQVVTPFHRRLGFVFVDSDPERRMVAEAVYPLPRAVLTVFLAIGVHRVGASTVDHGVRRDSPPLPLNVSCRDSLPDDCAGKLENTAWALLDLAAI